MNIEQLKINNTKKILPKKSTGFSHWKGCTNSKSFEILTYVFEPLHIICNPSAKPTPKLFIIHQRKRLHYSLRKSVLMNDEY